MKIFISYRRQDSTVITGRIYDGLVPVFGRKAVFRDIDNIPAGSDFRKVIDTEVGKCNIMLVIIGPQWTNITGDNGNKRLLDPDDFVRIEVESGLGRKDILVIPILVMGARLPGKHELPDSLQSLIYRNALVLRNDPDFRNDMQRLIRHIKKAIPATQRIHPRIKIGLSAIFLLALIVCGGAEISQFFSTNNTVYPSVESGYKFVFSTPTHNDELSEISVGAGFGARGDGWQLYFTNPSNNQNPITSIDASNLVNKTIVASRSVSLYQEPNQDSMIIARVAADEKFLIDQVNEDNFWLHVKLQNGMEGWMQMQDVVLVSATPISPIVKSQYGINIRLVDAIGRVKNTLDIAAFLLDEEEITNAILEADKNGVTVHIVADLENFTEQGNTFQALVDEGIPVVTNNTTSLMHNNFMILDGSTVWTGSWNYTSNSTFKNNENALVFTSPQITYYYQTEFNKMFYEHEFGRNKSYVEQPRVNIGEGTVDIFFAPDERIPSTIVELLSNARESIRMMTYYFSLTDYAEGIIQALQRGVQFRGIIETRSADSEEVSMLMDAGADIRYDGNEYLLHHNVLIIDDAIVITGSMNFSASGSAANDENILVINDTTLAGAYNAEFDRLWEVAK